MEESPMQEQTARQVSMGPKPVVNGYVAYLPTETAESLREGFENLNALYRALGEEGLAVIMVGDEPNFRLPWLANKILDESKYEDAQCQALALLDDHLQVKKSKKALSKTAVIAEIHIGTPITCRCDPHSYARHVTDCPIRSWRDVFDRTNVKCFRPDLSKSSLFSSFLFERAAANFALRNHAPLVPQRLHIH